jgi:hexosaminidase
MFRSASIFKVVILSLAANSVFILYLLFHNVNQKLHNDENQYYDRVNDYYSFYANTPISTTIKIIPIPMFVSASHSRLSLSKGFGIKSNQKSTADLQLAILRYSKYISLITGLSTKIDENLSPSRNSLIIDCPTINSKTTKYPVVDEDEFYTLNVTKTGSYLYALSLTGIIRGLSTFVQLIERDSSSKQNSIPLVNIVDQPRFTWRGLLLDVSRHWMPVPVIERTLNAMELSKLNVLHLHLSDDQGFRVESIQHNLLHDKQDFFTQKDIRHLVEYARQRRIRIVPEFDIPGHTTR